MTSRERVKRAIHFKNPDKMPIYYFNKDIELSDIIAVSYGGASSFVPTEPGQTEWGFTWERVDDTMGQPKTCPISDWSLLDSFVPPDGTLPERFVPIANARKQNPDIYLIAGMGITGFNLVTFLRGFEDSLMDFYEEPEKMDQLCDMVFSFEEDLIRGFAKAGADAVAFYDDWGTQNSLMISPNQWRELFLPRYKRQFDLIHELGMDVFFHSCGYVYDIIPDLIDIGADMLNLNQLDLFGVERIGKDFAGKVCFVCPVDHQTTAIRGTREEIFDYVHRMKNSLDTEKGGFIANIEEYSSVGMSDENYRALCDAFESVR